MYPPSQSTLCRALNGLTNITLSPQLFVNNPKLQVVSIDSSGLKTLPTGLFRHNPNLLQVSLQGNYLTPLTLPEDLFDYVNTSSSVMYLYVCHTAPAGGQGV